MIYLNRLLSLGFPELWGFILSFQYIKCRIFAAKYAGKVIPMNYDSVNKSAFSICRGNHGNHSEMFNYRLEKRKQIWIETKRQEKSLHQRLRNKLQSNLILHTLSPSITSLHYFSLFCFPFLFLFLSLTIQILLLYSTT